MHVVVRFDKLQLRRSKTVSFISVVIFYDTTSGNDEAESETRRLHSSQQFFSLYLLITVD